MHGVPCMKLTDYVAFTVGTAPIDYFESHFPDIPRYADVGETSKPDWLVSVTTKVDFPNTA